MKIIDLLKGKKYPKIFITVQGLKRVGPYDSNDTEGGEETVKEEAMEEQTI